MRGCFCHLASRILIFSCAVALTNPAFASGLKQDAEAKALAHYIMALCLDINGQADQAVGEYQQSIEYNALEPAPRLKLGAYFLHLNKLSESIKQLKMGIELAPDNAEAHYLLALAYSSGHQNGLAAAEYEKILKSAAQADPADTEAYMYLGQLYYSQKRYPEAIEQFLKVVRLDPANLSALDLLGSVYADSGLDSAAIGLFRQVLKVSPEDAQALNSLGYIYAQEGGHLNEAIRMIRRAIDIEPSNGAYYDSLGWALYKKGDYKESLLTLKKAGAFIEDEILYDHLGDVFNALKDYVEAVANWRKSLEMDPEQMQVKQKLEKCIVLQSNHQRN